MVRRAVADPGTVSWSSPRSPPGVAGARAGLHRVLRRALLHHRQPSHPSAARSRRASCWCGWPATAARAWPSSTRVHPSLCGAPTMPWRRRQVQAPRPGLLGDLLAPAAGPGSGPAARSAHRATLRWARWAPRARPARSARPRWRRPAQPVLGGDRLRRTGGHLVAAPAHRRRLPGRRRIRRPAPAAPGRWSARCPRSPRPSGPASAPPLSLQPPAGAGLRRARPLLPRRSSPSALLRPPTRAASARAPICRWCSRPASARWCWAAPPGSGWWPVCPSRSSPSSSSGRCSMANSTQPIPASWTTIARAGPGGSGGARWPTIPDPAPSWPAPAAWNRSPSARRLSSESAACALPCDLDPREPSRAQNSAAYLELPSDIEVAIVDDTNFLLHAVRTEVRPAGPEVDGFLGAAALASARVELDYVATQPRGIFSCEPGSPPASCCRAVARCPRLPGRRPAPRLFRSARTRACPTCAKMPTTCAD